MFVGKKPVFSSTAAVLFAFIYSLSAFCGHRTSCDLLPESSLKSRRDGRSINFQMDILASTIAADGSDGLILSTQASGIIFDPPTLDFEEQSVGMPELKTVHIHNPNHFQPLHLNSISGDSPVFHASFFKSKVLKLGDSTTFDVIFLGRMPEDVQTSLYIQTSLGTFNYKVQGVGIPNQFRLRSILGARIPLNATYSPFITMFNPYNTTLQVTEMYSSSGDLHLELLTGQSRGLKSLWEIRPFETKAIGRANFFGRMITNHTSFIRIKTNHSTGPSIVLPVEVEVADSSGLFLSREILDFGILKSGESKSLPLYILNAGSSLVTLEPISIVPENPAVEVDFTSFLLKPGSKYAKVASVTFYSDRVSSFNQTSGVLVIRGVGRTSHLLKVPFDVNVLHGCLSYEKSKTLFRVGHPPFHAVVHKIPLSSQFEVPVVIYDVKLPSKAQEYFSVTSFSGPYILPPDSKWHYPFSVELLPTSSDCLFSTTLRLSTNSTYFTIPIYCYDGRVKYVVEDTDNEDTLDYGVLSNLASSSKVFTIQNVNPVKITSFTVSSGLPHTSVELISIHPTNLSISSSGFLSRPPHIVDVTQSASFRVNVTKPESTGTFSGEILIHTSLDHVLRVPVFYKTVTGGLRITPEVVRFDPVFPFGVSEVPVYVENLYREPVVIVSVKREPQDPRFFLRKVTEDRSVDYPELQPNELIQIGTAVFDPLLEAGGESVYLGMGDSGVWNRFNTASSQASMNRAKQSDLVADLKHFSLLLKSWNSVMEEGENVLNFSYILTPYSGVVASVPATATLVWPRLLDNVKGNILEFPTTTIGSSSVMVVNVTNPSYQPLLIQPVLLQHYSRFQSVVDLLSEYLDPDLHNLDFSPLLSSSFEFSQDNFSTNGDSSLANTMVHPNNSFQISIAFSPTVGKLANTLLLIRNNLTVFDYVLLRGHGIQGLFSINGIQPSSDPLLFEFTHAMMERCQAGPFLEPMKISHVFGMHNSGLTPLTLYLVGVGMGGRKDGGFAVVNYKREIIIKPNKTKSIEISFTPDFTISRVSSTLSFKMSSGTEILYPLLAIIPHNLLAVCYAMQPRPEWEQTLVWLSVPFWFCMLVTVVAVVLIQTNFGVIPELNYQNDSALPLVQATGGHVFDLRNVGISRKQTKPETLNSTTGTNGKLPENLRPTNSHHVSPAPLARPMISSQEPCQYQVQREQAPDSLINTRKYCNQSDPVPNETTLLDRLHPHSFEWTSEKESRDCPVPTKSRVKVHDHSLGSLDTDQTSIISSQIASLFSPDVHAADPRSEGFTEVDAITSQVTKGSVCSLSGAVAELMQTDSVSGEHVVLRCSPKPVKPNSLNAVDAKMLDSSEANDVPTPDTTTETISPTTGVYTAPSSNKKHKATWKCNSKGMKITDQPAESSPPPVSSLPLKQDLNQDHLVRKESDSSIKSADSESTTSCGDKCDEKDFSEVVPALLSLADAASTKSEASPEGDGPGSPLESNSQHIPFGKEPNTGQTMPSDDLEVILSEDVLKKENLRVKNKRKQRQLKKEEKLKKKDREKASRVRDKHQNASVEQPSYQSFENVENRNLDTDETSAVKSSSTSKKSICAKPEPSVKGKPKPSNSNSTLEYVEDGQAVTHRKARAIWDPSSDRGVISFHSSHHVLSTSFPSTAIKSSRGGQETKAQFKDLLMDPFSRNPDRSTYASKKACSKKPSSDRASKLAPGDTREDTTFTSGRKISVNGIQESDVTLVEESEWTSALDANEDMDDEMNSAASSTCKDQQQILPTPHDLAASVLSKIPMKIKKVQSSPTKSNDSLDFEEEEGELVKVQNLKFDETLRQSGPSTVFPMKDSSLSSPSPPLPVGQQKLSTLSLDAEPFYPSSNFKSAKKQVKPTHKGKVQSKNKAGEARSGELEGLEVRSKRQSSQRTGRNTVSLPNDNAPHAISPAEKAVMDRAEIFHQQTGKSSTPPPAFGTSYAQTYGLSEPPYDGQDTSVCRQLPEREPRAFYSVDDDLFQHIERLPNEETAVDPYLVSKNYRHRMPPHSRQAASLLYHKQQKLQQQQMSGYLSPPPGYEGPPMHAHPLLEEDLKNQQILMHRKQLLLDLYRQERAVLAAAYAREQARKSAEALNSLHRPSHISAFSSEPSKHLLTGNLWDEYFDSVPSTLPSKPHQQPCRDLDGSFHNLQSSYSSLSDSSSTQVPPTNIRSLNSGIDIGGGILPSYHHTGQQPASVSPPICKPAACTNYSLLDQRQSGGLEDSVPDCQEHLGTLVWSPDAAEGSTADWENGGHSKWPSPTYSKSASSHHETIPPLSSTPSFSGTDLSSDPSQSYITNTYELFENQSIWSLNNSGSESSNLLSWALLGAEQSKNSSDQ